MSGKVPQCLVHSLAVGDVLKDRGKQVHRRPAAQPGDVIPWKFIVRMDVLELEALYLYLQVVYK